MKLIIILYFVILVFVMLLALLSLDEKITVLGEKKPEGIELIFLKTAAYVYRRFIKKNRFFMKSRARRHVRDNLQKLNSEGDMASRLNEYFIRKISVVLMIIFLGGIVSILSCYASGRDRSLNGDGELLRAQNGEGEKRTKLVATDETGEKIGDFDVVIGEMEYSEEETKKLYKEMLENLPSLMLLENEDLKHVKSDLNLPEKVKGYPFDISWKSDDLDVLRSDGKVINDDIFFESTWVLLTATITYKDYEWEQCYEINVIPLEFSDEEILRGEIEERIKKTEEGTREEDRFSLPAKAQGTELFWREIFDDNSIMVFILSVVAAAAVFIGRDRDLMKKVEERRRKMILEYPAFVSRLVLYMGSGMAVRAILTKFADEYKVRIKDGGKHSFLYEEIVKSCHELESGVPEINVYERLGIRCGSQQYARLVTLLSQNLKKGSSEMMSLLREESDKATAERMSYARKLGEEAGTKLLVPMIMMLLIVMVVIMVPAYLSF